MEFIKKQYFIHKKLLREKIFSHDLKKSQILHQKARFVKTALKLLYSLELSHGEKCPVID